MPGYIPVFEAGNQPTATASADVTGGKLLAVSGSGTVAMTAGATPSFLGTALNDAKAGKTVDYARGGEQELTAVGAITAGDRVEPAAGGNVTKHTNGTTDYNACGTATTTAADGALVRVAMDR